MIAKIKSLVSSSTARDSAFGFAGNLSAAILGAFFFALTARSLGPKDFGLFSLALITAAFIKDLLSPVIGAGLLRFVPSNQGQKANGYVKALAVISLSYFAVVLPIFILFSKFFTTIIFKEHRFALLHLTLITSLVYFIGSFLSTWLQAQRRFKIDAVLTFSQPLLRLAGYFLLLYSSDITIQSLLVVNIAAYLIISMIGIFIIKTNFIKSKIDSQTKSNIQNFIPPLVLASLSGTATDKISLYITNFFTTTIQVGLLAAVSRLMIPAQQLAGAMSGVFGSRFSNFATKQEADKYLLKAFMLSGLVFLGMIVATLFSKPIILLIYGASYIKSNTVFKLLTIGFGLFVLNTPFTAYLLYFKSRSDVAALLSFIQMLLTIILGYLLIPRLNIVGAGISLVLTMLLMFIATTISTQVFPQKKVKN